MEATPAPDSTPKKILFWENRANETQRLEEELMTSRIREMEALTELRELRLKVMELETQVNISKLLGVLKLKRWLVKKNCFASSVKHSLSHFVASFESR